MSLTSGGERTELCSVVESILVQPRDIDVVFLVLAGGKVAEREPFEFVPPSLAQQRRFSQQLLCSRMIPLCVFGVQVTSVLGREGAQDFLIGGRVSLRLFPHGCRGFTGAER